MATHPSILAWEIPQTEEPGGVQSTGWQAVGYDCVTNIFTLGKQIPNKKSRSHMEDRGLSYKETLSGPPQFPGHVQHGDLRDPLLSCPL